MKAKSTKGRVPERRLRPQPPQQSEKLMLLLDTFERCQWESIVKNSYVISRVWAWVSKIEWSPRLKIPIPRSFSYRDP